MTFDDDHDEVITVVEKYTPVGTMGWRPKGKFGGRHGRLVGLAVLVVTVSWFGLIVWLAKAGADSFRRSLRDVTQF